MEENGTKNRLRPAGEVLRGALLLAALWAAMLAALVLTALIPRAAIRPHMEEAAAHYAGTTDFAFLREGDERTLIHNYADAVLLNIIWNQDGEHPLRAALSGALYDAEASREQVQNLADTVAGAEPNRFYARYWHGMTAVLKPLLCVLSLNRIKLLGAAVLAVLAGACILLLLRRGLRAAAVSLGAALVLTWSWVTPLCLEYYPCFALTFAGADLILWKKGELKRPWLFFGAMGALVCYFDFLTCEILTLGLPLMVLLLLRGEDRKQSLNIAALCCGAWLGAYGLTWLCKWGLSAAVLDQSVREVALGQGLHRALGDLGVDGDYGLQALAAVVVNLFMLQPFRALGNAFRIQAAALVLTAALVGLWASFHRKEDGPALPVFLLSLLPFVRYACISNHSALHAFMTFRDLILTLVGVTCAMALSMSLREPQRPARPKKGRKK